MGGEGRTYGPAAVRLLVGFLEQEWKLGGLEAYEEQHP